MKDKTIILGVTGSIAAYKAVDLASKLTQKGAKVDVIMTSEAQHFVTPLTFRSITGRPVITSMWELSTEFSVEHVALAEAADIVVIAPATANIIAKIAAGLADDMLSCTVLDTKAPILIAPAMHTEMYQNRVTQENIKLLKDRGIYFIGPVEGRLASGGMGIGRFIDVDEIIDEIEKILSISKNLLNRKIIITAGGTQELIDPVRCITNFSSGKMGYALAEAARDRGATVTLISAPTYLQPPSGVKIINVVSAEDMLNAVKQFSKDADALIMAAAVADYRPKEKRAEKIKRQKSDILILELERTPDILSLVKGDFIKIGFAAESQNLLQNAMQKLQKKKLDLIVANDITLKDSGFGSDNNKVTLIDRHGNIEDLPLMSKRKVAEKILDKLMQMIK